MTELEQKPKLAGLDRKLEILNGISSWIQNMSEAKRYRYFNGMVDFPEEIFTPEMFDELVKIGTARQELDAALQGITISGPRKIDLV